MTFDPASIATLITAIGVLMGSQGVVALLQRRQMKSDIGDTGDSSLVEMVEQLNVRTSNIEYRLDNPTNGAGNGH